MIPHVIPPARPFTFLCTEIWPSAKSILRIPATTPVLFLSGRKDELVPPSHMDKLYALCKSERKVWKSIQDGTHSEYLIEVRKVQDTNFTSLSFGHFPNFKLTSLSVFLLFRRYLHQTRLFRSDLFLPPISSSSLHIWRHSPFNVFSLFKFQ